MCSRWGRMVARAARARMRILAPGRNNRAEKGFTLLEMLVVLAIMGITGALVGVGLVAGRERQLLRQDAEVLSQLFMAAQAQARHQATAIVWRYGAKGFGFESVAQTPYLPVDLARHVDLSHQALSARNPTLRARGWQSEEPVRVRVYPPAMAVFSREWMSGPRVVELDNGLTQVRIVRSAQGQYRVQP
ncbi:MAG: type II secretion system protein GspH [Pusillimonas sp.]|nr:type II secretion system protein GspH [Pusillimonas sp.]